MSRCISRAAPAVTGLISLEANGSGLTGGEFTANWNDLSLGDLYERIRISMPQNAPGSLSRQQNSDILSYILSKMNTPVGQTELSTNTDELKGIKFVAQKPAGN